jgi:hypothetical protein
MGKNRGKITTVSDYRSYCICLLRMGPLQKTGIKKIAPVAGCPSVHGRCHRGFSKNGMVPVYPDFTTASYGTQNLHSIPTFGIWLAPEKSLQFPIDCTFPVALHSFPPEHLIEQYCSCTGDIERVHSIVHRNCRGIIAYFKHLSRNATVLVSENNTAISRKIDLVH